MEKILKAIPQKLEPTGLFLTDAERTCIAEALIKVGIQHKSDTAKEIFDQIEEIARDICGHCIEGICELDGKKCDLKCTNREIAEKIYSKGYRKFERGERI